MDDIEVGLMLLSQAKKDGVSPNLVMCRCLIGELVCFYILASSLFSHSGRIVWTQANNFSKHCELSTFQFSWIYLCDSILLYIEKMLNLRAGKSSKSTSMG